MKLSKLPIQGLLKEKLNQHSSYYLDSVYFNWWCVFLALLSDLYCGENVELDLLVCVVCTTNKCNSTWLAHQLVIGNISNGFHFNLKVQQFCLVFFHNLAEVNACLFGQSHFKGSFKECLVGSIGVLFLDLNRHWTLTTTQLVFTICCPVK